MHHQYKYQINIDGTVAAYRLPYLLAGDSVVLKQDSGYYEHFYKQLRAWEHYIPVRADLRDLLEKIQWARDHDEEVTRTRDWILAGFTNDEWRWCHFVFFFQAKKIALAGQQFARSHLMGDTIFCYYYILIKVMWLQFQSYCTTEKVYNVTTHAVLLCSRCVALTQCWSFFIRTDVNVSHFPHMSYLCVRTRTTPNSRSPSRRSGRTWKSWSSLLMTCSHVPATGQTWETPKCFVCSAACLQILMILFYFLHVKKRKQR